jgi:hypothetical protein
MIFKHFTNTPFLKFKTPHLKQELKPKEALWLSCNNDWIKWIKKEKMDWKYKYEYEFTIDESKLIIIKTYADAKEFDKKYGVKGLYTIDEQLQLYKNGSIKTMTQLKKVFNLFDAKFGHPKSDNTELHDIQMKEIDWNKVKKDYSGIFVKTPDIQKAKNEFSWYVSFDICSIAIWKKDAILGVT